MNLHLLLYRHVRELLAIRMCIYLLDFGKRFLFLFFTRVPETNQNTLNVQDFTWKERNVGEEKTLGKEKKEKW